MPVDRMIHPCMGDSEKVAKLTELEFRVWIVYMLTADDFGVLPLVASKLQGADRALRHKSAKQLTRALESAVSIDLTQAFTHQQEIYVWSATWQKYQRIRYPRRETIYPPPPEATLRALTHKDTAPTRDLFATFHTRVSDAFRLEFGDEEALAKIAAREAKRSEKLPKRSGAIPGMEQERSGDIPTLTRAGARETAHGLRPMAEVVLEEGSGETAPLDRWLRELQNGLYPSQRVTRNQPTEFAFCDAMLGFSAGPHAAWVLLKANLAANRDSYEWRVKGMVPKLEKYLREGTWRNAPLPASPPAAEQMSKSTARTLEGAAAFLKQGA